MNTLDERHHQQDRLTAAGVAVDGGGQSTRPGAAWDIFLEDGTVLHNTAEVTMYLAVNFGASHRHDDGTYGVVGTSIDGCDECDAEVSVPTETRPPLTDAEREDLFAQIAAGTWPPGVSWTYSSSLGWVLDARCPVCGGAPDCRACAAPTGTVPS